jgi:predicted component of type VI protein secretion system
MQVEVQLVGKPNRWIYQQRRIRIGRDSSCDISLSSDEFPTVSREHVVLEFNDGIVSLSDPRSGNGTYLRGQRVSSGTLQSGDIIRLGVDGPELRIFITEAAAQTKLAGATDTARTQIADAVTKTSTATIFGASPTVIGNPFGFEAAAPTVGDSPTILGRGAGDDTTRLAHASQFAEAPHQPSVRAHEIRVALGSDRDEVPQVRVPEPAADPKRPSDFGDEQMIEQKLNSIRTLLAVNLVVVLSLVLGLFYENQQIERNRKALMEMRMQAATALGQFQPELDTRLNTFDKRMDSLDGKMKDEEDHFVSRMNTEIPAMLDKYIDRKMAGAKHQAETVPH